MIQRRHALVLSPAPSHPTDQGNRNRVMQSARFLAGLKYQVHFVLYPRDPDWQHQIPPSYEAMGRAWASFTVVPPSRAEASPAAGRDHGIDEWWDPAIATHLDWLFDHIAFEVVWVHYAFFSRAFERAPPQAVKVLDCHDVLAGRRRLFEQAGCMAEGFYTTEEQERIAFDRADLVVAIKESERAAIAQRTARRVFTMPYFPMHWRPPTPGPGAAPLVAAFLGSSNGVNRMNMSGFVEVFRRHFPAAREPVRLVIAGEVCRHLRAGGPAVALLGRLEDLEAFYDSVDVVVVPFTFSTGVKIKVIEALAYGKPVVATANAFDGLPACDPFHMLPDMPAVCAALRLLAADPARLALLAQRSERSAVLAAAARDEAERALGQAIAAGAQRHGGAAADPPPARTALLAPGE